MIRTVLYFYIILLVITGGLLLTHDLHGTNSTRVFLFLDSSVNTFLTVGASGDVNGLASQASLSSGTNPFEAAVGFVNSLKLLAVNLFSIFVFLAVGSVDILEVIDPTHTWGLLIIAPIALMQFSGFVFILIEIIGALRGSG